MSVAEEGRGISTEAGFATRLREVAREGAPRLFALVEEYGEAQDARVAGYGLAYENRADVTSVEGDFRLRSENAENAGVLFGISSASAGVRRVHVAWLN